MGALIILLPLVPLAAALLIGTVGWRTATAWTAPLSSLAVLAGGIACAVHVLDDGPVVALDGQFRVDALSALMLMLIGTVAAITTTYGIAYLDDELARGVTTPPRARLYGVLVQVTVAAMTVVVSADNLGVMWVAIETTTIATVFLVGHRHDRASVEASWKYLVLGSVGVATALLGTVLVYFVSRHAGADASTALHWSVLVERASGLDSAALRVGIGLVIVGYGTKAGLAPLHSWLPDAYSQAPAPVAALMSGAVSALSMYALLRFKVIADPALGTGYTRTLLVTAALASLVFAASLMLTQRDYKRLLAYSSVEHMGLIALAAAIGSPLAMSAVLLHLIGNGVAKSVAFSATGEMLVATGSTLIRDVRGLLRARPFAGTMFGLGLVALVGFPPFSLFASEIAIIRAGVAGGLTWAIAIAAVVLLAVFTAVAVHALDMLAGPAEPLGGAGGGHPHALGDAARQDSSMVTRIALVGGLLIAAALGITVWPIGRLLEAAAGVLVP